MKTTTYTKYTLEGNEKHRTEVTVYEGKINLLQWPEGSFSLYGNIDLSKEEVLELYHILGIYLGVK